MTKLRKLAGGLKVVARDEQKTPLMARPGPSNWSSGTLIHPAARKLEGLLGTFSCQICSEQFKDDKGADYY
jgi:hypothetical protein